MPSPASRRLLRDCTFICRVEREVLKTSPPYAAQHERVSVRTVTGDSNLHKLWCIRARDARAHMGALIICAHFPLELSTYFSDLRMEHETAQPNCLPQSFPSAPFRYKHFHFANQTSHSRPQRNISSAFPFTLPIKTHTNCLFVPFYVFKFAAVNQKLSNTRHDVSTCEPKAA